MIKGLPVALGMLLLVLDSKTALLGAKEGVMLCLSSVIPALLPFWVLSSLLSAALWGRSAGPFRFLGRLFSLPKGAESILIPAFLGGYPAGAGCIGKAYREGKLERGQASRLLGYCSNVGPAFLFGIAAPQFSSPWTGVYLWLLQILGAWVCSRLLPGKTESQAQMGKEPPGDTLAEAAEAMGKICISVILFRTLLAFLNPLLEGNALLRCLISGLLELTNGCCMLSPVAERLRLPLAAGLMSFGGLCVFLQTASVAKGLDLRYYALGRCISCGVCLAGAVCPWSLPGILGIPILKKWVAFFRKGVYNGRNKERRRTLCFSERK